MLLAGEMGAENRTLLEADSCSEYGEEDMMMEHVDRSRVPNPNEKPLGGDRNEAEGGGMGLLMLLEERRRALRLKT